MPDPGYSCPCGFNLWIPVATLETSSLGLYDDSRYRGRCILALREHATNLEELAPSVAEGLMLDIQTSGRAIRKAVSAERMNYAVLGNIEPHLHAHLIPRGGPGQDPIPRRSPWEHPDEPAPLPSKDIQALVQAIAAEIHNDGSVRL